MRYGGDLRAHVAHAPQSRTVAPALEPARFRHRNYECHVWRFTTNVKVFGRPLVEHARRDRTEAFAKLDLLIEPRLHVRIARIRKYASRAERARAEFHSPLEPAHHSAVGDQLRRGVFCTRAGGLVVLRSAPFQCGSDLVGSESR